MKEQRQHRFTAKIADVEPFQFTISEDEEAIFRKAAFHLDQLWRKMMNEQPGKSSHYALAKAALAFAELYYRKSEQLSEQSRLLESFDHELDDILMGME